MLVSEQNLTEKSKSFDGQLIKHNFDWSLKPLTGLMKFTGGINLQTFEISKSNSVIKHVLFAALAAFVIVSNIVINRSCVKTRLYALDDSLWTMYPLSDSPWANFFINPRELLNFTRFYSALVFFCFVPAMHLIFFIIVLLSQRWKCLIDTFQCIHHRMKMAERFYRKCRRLCSFLMLVFVLVNELFRRFVKCLNNRFFSI